MFVYIPRHLERIEIVSEMTQILRGYIKTYGFSDSKNFDYYYYYYTSDPVKNFIRMCLSQKYVREGFFKDLEDVVIDDGVLWYLMRLFYSVKGTPKVLELMESELGLEFIPDESGNKFVYSDSRIAFNINEINTFNINSFMVAQEKFLGALLYYYDITNYIREANLSITEDLKSSVSLKTWTYTKYETRNLQ